MDRGEKIADMIRAGVMLALMTLATVAFVFSVYSTP
jgi:hypothetical protein